MRTWLLVFVCLFPFSLDAQVQQQAQQRLPATEAPLGCYESLKTRGVQAQKAGNCDEALRLFREAFSCKEVRDNGLYRSELNILVARCEAIQRAAQTGTQTGIRGKGRYKPSAAFLQNRDPNCYAITLAEAKKAFDLKLWEDAAALYRAAKICADADQDKRQEMNDRIEMCRAKAEEELLDKERVALRQARQAIASTRAGDATALLLRGDRTRAYRLADFANEYIAPENIDNPDCLQTMFDAWYFDPAMYEYFGANFKVPFCYQLTDNLGENTQVRFYGKGAQARIYVFAPKRHLLQVWDAETLKPLRSVSVDTSFREFDIFPDGRTLLFTSKQGYILWRSNTQTFRINVTKDRCYDIDTDGNQFHYYDPETSSIQSLSLQTVFGGAKAYQSQRSALTKQRIGKLPAKPLKFKLRSSELWLLFQEEIAVMESNNTGEEWQLSQRWQLNNMPQNTPDEEGNTGYRYYVMPESRSIIASGSFETIEWQLPDNTDSLVQPYHSQEVRLLGANENAALRAYWQYSEQANSYVISITENTTASTVFGMLSPLSDDLSAHEGAFSEDMRWFGIANSVGTVKLWSLLHSSNTRIDKFPDALLTHMSPNGLWAATWENDRIAVFKSDNLKEAQYSIPRPEANMPFLQMGNEWLVYRHNMDSIGIWNWKDNTHRLWPTTPADYAGSVFALGEEQDRIAFNVGNDSVEVRSLRTGQFIASKSFSGSIVQLAFFPGGNELLVIQNLAREYLAAQQMTPRIWNINQPDQADKHIRLHGAEVYYADIDKSGRKIALSDSRFIRIYHTDSLQEESLLLRPIGDKYVTSLRFHANSDSLAVAYNDGSILFWDTKSGRIQVQFSPVIGLSSNFIQYLTISNEGNILRWITEKGEVITRLFSTNMDAIRQQAQDEYRQLTAFTPEDIRDYELASALEYPGNFERLATSADLPLIRSFFDYYRTQAINSNNISRVSDYCDRSFRLYIQLEEAGRQDLQTAMQEMYYDFSWKLLLRNQPEKARSVAQLLNDFFNQPAGAQLILAHAALLSNDFTTATRHYTEWAIRDMEESPAYFSNFELLYSTFLQLDEFDLLTDRQAACLCSQFGSLFDLHATCNQAPATQTNFFDAETSLRWSIFLRLKTIYDINSLSDKTTVLLKLLDDIETLRKRYTGSRTGILHKRAVEALAQNYTERSNFEQTSPRAIALLKELEQILQKSRSSEIYKSQMSWLKASNDLALGNQYFIRGRLDSADYYYKLALDASQNVRPTEGEETERFNNELLGSLWTQIGQCELALRLPGQAKESFRKANEFLTYGLNTLYLGHAAVLNGEEGAAWEYYSGIFNEEQLGLACADLESLAGYLPLDRNRLLQWSSRLRDSLLAQQPGLDPAAVQYYYAQQKINYTSYRHDWTGAREWSEKALQSAKTMYDSKKAPYLWRDVWLNAHINLAYYLLFSSLKDNNALSNAIRYSEMAEQHIKDNNEDYANRSYLYTNLAHAYWLRNQEGDRQKAVDLYQTFLGSPLLGDGWETLQKDFRDLHEAGIQWPDLRSLIAIILPDVQVSDPEWLEMGVSPSDR